MRVSFEVNGQPKTVEVDGDWPLLWVVRDVLELKGTKFGCGMAACGACTLHVDGQAIRSCSYAVKHAERKSVTTIEGLSDGTRCTRCSKHGSSTSCRSAATASPAS